MSVSCHLAVSRVHSSIMDLVKQIGSLFVIGFPGPTLNKEMDICRNIVDYNLGGVILFNRCLHDPSLPGNIVSAEQLPSLCASLQEAAGGQLLIGVDQEGGRVRRLRPEAGFTDICSAEEMGSSGPDTRMTRQQAAASAAMLAAAGINCNFAPVVDCAINPSNPVIGAIGRSFSDNSDMVARHAAVWIAEHRKQGIISCLKHFPGHGSSAADSHLGFVDISSTWQPKELDPYRQLIQDDQVELVMTGHLFNKFLDSDYPATLSPAIINGLLRSDLGYSGPIISDDMQMKAITDHFGFAEAVCKSLAAGVDMLIFGNNLDYERDICRRAVQAVLDCLDQKIINEKQIQAAVGRVSNLKQRLGIKHGRANNP